jgi:3-oxoacyl-[acyl-carrier-protein] synthase III
MEVRDFMEKETTQSVVNAAVAKRSRVGSLTGVQIVGVGAAVPYNPIHNRDLAALGYDADWIEQRSGILERRHAAPDTSTSDLAIEASIRCIELSSVNRSDIDLLLLGTYTPDMLMPATASIVQDKLGLCAPAFDLQAACASFIFALLSGAQYVATGCSRLALIIGADCTSRVINSADKQTYPLFGDGAGAVLLAPGSNEQGILAFSAGSDGAGFDLLNRPMGGAKKPFSTLPEHNGQHFMRMDGRPIFKWSVKMLRETTTEVLLHSGLKLEDINLAIFHQANMRIINSAVADIGLDPAKVVSNLDRYGNTSSASIPLALDEAFRAGRINRGDVLLLSGFGGGLAWATMLIRW